MGAYSTFLALIVIVAAIVINLLVSQLPSNITKLDTSENALYTISDETKELVKTINDKVTFYVVAETGNEDETILEVLDKYKALNSKISVQKVDPVLRPGFSEKYVSGDSELVPNSVIVESDKRFTVVSYYDIYVTKYSDEELMYYYQYGVTPTGTTTFAAENEFTSAIDYVTTELLPTLYALQGHGESPLSENILKYIDMENIEISDLTLFGLEAVPQDTTCIFINAPSQDVSEDEFNMLMTYVKSGGKIMLITDPQTFSSEKMPRLSEIAAYFGVKSEDGLIYEGNQGMYYRYKNVLLPSVSVSSLSATISNSNFYTMLYNAHGIVKTDDGGIGTITPLLTTSSSSYIKKSDTGTTEKEEGDIQGPFYTGVMVEDSASGSSLFWVSCAQFMNQNYDYMVSYGNSNLFLGVTTRFCEKKSSISILAKDMNVVALKVSEGASNILGVVFILVIPVVIAGVGLLLWTKRRKR